jgi:SAM-dependent methyltransferase/uncharacterized C2H2 Zn-finger protein
MTTAIANLIEHSFLPSEEQLWLRCPRCSHGVGPVSDRDDGVASSALRCERCDSVVLKSEGVWRTISPHLRSHFAAFVQDYEEIRRSEGRGCEHPAFYLALPFADLTGNFCEQWRIRGRSYRYLERHILPRLEARYGKGFRVLDIGAGNGWLSYRLALNGHRPAAVDLCGNPADGLEAAGHYASVLAEFFPRFQADMDHLPFEDEQFDVAIYNASFHYSTNYERTLQEALRCLRPGGTILIVDSPTYSSAQSGEAMRRERQRHFHERFGRRGNALPINEYLTPEILNNVSHLGIRWNRHLAWYGVRWWLRPWIARLKRRREPSQFYLYEGRMETP